MIGWSHSEGKKLRQADYYQRALAAMVGNYLILQKRNVLTTIQT